jgi:hypothetical protein
LVKGGDALFLKMYPFADAVKPFDGVTELAGYPLVAPLGYPFVPFCWYPFVPLWESGGGVRAENPLVVIAFAGSGRCVGLGVCPWYGVLLCSGKPVAVSELVLSGVGVGIRAWKAGDLGRSGKPVAVRELALSGSVGLCAGKPDPVRVFSGDVGKLALPNAVADSGFIGIDVAGEDGLAGNIDKSNGFVEGGEDALFEYPVAFMELDGIAGANPDVGMGGDEFLFAKRPVPVGVDDEPNLDEAGNMDDVLAALD